jgi:O-antigen chain-terminating methyltransferase
MSASSPELDVDQLMTAIRETVLKKHPNLDTDARPEAIPSGLPLPHPLTNIRAPLMLSPEFMFQHNDTYHVNDLLKYHDRDFIKNAYRAILKREPDEAGYLYNLQLLQSGGLNKIDILSSLRYSDEGNATNVTINGLRLPATIRTLERIPVLGYLLQLLLALVRLPLMIRSQRQFQGYVVAQQLAIADYVNGINDQINDFVNQRQRTDENKLQEREERANLKNLVHALEAMVNEKVLPMVINEREKLHDAETLLLHLEARHSDLTQTVSRVRQQISGLASDIRVFEQDLAAERNRTTDDIHDWGKLYAAFEDQFRGSSEEVVQRLKYYLPFLQELNAGSKILDLGSGRGDWLRLLSKEGFNPCGVEVNEVFAERTRNEGLDVTHSEMMLYLARQPDESFDLITAFHLIEHLNADNIIRLLHEIKRTLKPGGRLFIETPSPENLVVAACNFYADPTHHKPVNPHTLVFILKEMGFTDLGLQFLHFVDGSPFQGDSKGSEQLHMWFYGPRDYSVNARKAQ